MKKLISFALALVLMLSCLTVTAFAADKQPNTEQMIEYRNSPCSLTVPKLPKYIKGTFDYDETKSAILTDHPGYEGRGFVFPLAGEDFGSLYDVSFSVDGTVITYEYTLKDGKTVDELYEAIDRRREAQGLKPVTRDFVPNLLTIDVAMRMIPDLYGTPAGILIKHDILEVTAVDGEVLYKNGVRTGEGYGFQSIAFPIEYDGDKVDVPSIVYARGFDGGVILRWKQSEKADHYAVYRKDKGEWAHIADAPYGYYLDPEAEQDGIYTYTVRGVDADGNEFSDWDQVGYTYQKDSSYGDASSQIVVDTPQITSLVSTANGINITWKPVWGAWKYRVYYKGSNGWTRMAETDQTHFLDREVKWGSSYTYTVRCINSAGQFISGYEQKGWSHTHYLDTPQITKLSSTGDGVSITWDKVDGAAQYRVYYKGRNGWTRMAQTSGTGYVDKDVSIGTTYTYTVRCLNAAGDTFTSSFNSAGWKYTYYPLNTPQITSFESTAKGVKINWGKIDGAEKYRVYYKGKNGWTKMGETTGTSFLDDDVKVGSTYRYTVRCINSALTKFTSDFDGTGWTYTFSPVLDTPHITGYEALADSVKISWGAVKGAAKYRVYYQIVDFNTGWKRAGETTGTSFNFKLRDYEKEADLPYIYTVRCITADGKGFCSDFDRSNAPFTFHDAPRITTSNTHDGVKISWNDRDNGTYRVYYKGSKGWTKMAQVTGNEYTDSDVRSGGTYTYTVRRVSSDGKWFESYYDTAGVRHTYDTSKLIPEIPHILVEDGEMYFYTGAPIAGVDKYRLFVWENGTWQRLANVDIDYDTYLDFENADEFYKTSDFTVGKTYTFTLRGMDSKGNYVTDFYRDGFTVAALELAYFNDISYDPETHKLTAAWDPVEGAKGYMVHFIPDPTQEIHEPMYIEDADSCTVDTVVYEDVPWTVYFGAYNDDDVFGTVIIYQFTPSDYDISKQTDVPAAEV